MGESHDVIFPEIRGRHAAESLANLLAWEGRPLCPPDLWEPGQGAVPWAQAELAPVIQPLDTARNQTLWRQDLEFKQAFSVKQLPRAVPWLGGTVTYLYAMIMASQTPLVVFKVLH